MKNKLMILAGLVVLIAVLSGCAGRRFAMDAVFDEDTLQPKTTQGEASGQD